MALSNFWPAWPKADGQNFSPPTILSCRDTRPANCQIYRQDIVEPAGARAVSAHARKVATLANHSRVVPVRSCCQFSTRGWLSISSYQHAARSKSIRGLTLATGMLCQCFCAQWEQPLPDAISDALLHLLAARVTIQRERYITVVESARLCQMTMRASRNYFVRNGFLPRARLWLFQSYWQRPQI